MDLDVTLFFHLALLAALVLVLRGWLFAPMLAVIESRHQKIFGTRHEVERLERLSLSDQEAYDKRMQEAIRLAQRERERWRQTGRDEARRLITQARSALAQVMNQTRDEVRAEEQKAQVVLHGDVAPVAQQLVNKLLGKKAA